MGNRTTQRVITYVDGFNLYFGLKSAGFKRYYWLDLSELSRRLLQPSQELLRTCYFTSRIRDNHHNQADRLRQNTYLEVLAHQGVCIQYGHYLEKLRKCHQCGGSWISYEEKMTDVNLAIQLLVDAVDDAYDVALVISGDSDLTTPVQRVRARYPHKRIIIAFPPKRHSAQLQKAATGYTRIGEDKLRKSQLPATLTKADGHVLSRPATWK